MVYFISTLNPQNSQSGIEKRCNMWWNYWNFHNEEVKWIQLPKQWNSDNISIIENTFLKIFSYKKLPMVWQIFYFFSGSTIKDLYKHNRILNKISSCLQPNDIIFIFRSYNLYYLSKKQLQKLISTSKNIYIDFDESDYLAINTFKANDIKWNIIKENVRKYEEFLLKQNNIHIYFSGKNEIEKISKLHQLQQLPKVFENKLLINIEFKKNRLTFPIKLLMIGTFSYFPNIEMLNELIHQLIPTLKNPNLFEFHIVGKGLNNVLTQKLHSIKQIKYHGTISDDELNELYKEIHFSLAPILSGGGTKYKLIEAMANSTPIIATNEAVDGLDISLNQQYIKYNKYTFEDDVFAICNCKGLYKLMQLSCYNTYNRIYKLNKNDD
jgi:glycosyltransferase involved in cell wall biosynthesis